MAKSPNILLILTDQQSASALSCAGNPWLETPNLDRLAGRGVRFESAYSTCPVCVPARTSLFYGAFPHEVMLPGTETDMGARLEDPKRGVRPEASGRLLFPQLAEAGYHCAYAGKWHVGQWGPTESLPEDARERFGVEKLCDIHDARTVRAAAGFLSRTHEAPFLLVASFDNPHNIHEWAMEGALPEGDLPEPPAPPHLPPLPPNFRPSPSEPSVLEGIRQFLQKGVRRGPEDWQRYRWAYNRLVEKVDAQIGEVLDSLEANGLTDDTLVIFSSDHGDGQGAHELPFKSTFYDESCRVPLILAGPGTGRPGSVRSRPSAACINIYATILAAAGVPAEAPGIARGHDLRAPEDGVGVDSRAVVSMIRNPYGGTQGRMVRTERYKYIAYQNGLHREQIYDMGTDPGEQVNLAECARFADTRLAHREILRRWCQATNDRFGGGHYVHPEVPFMLPGDSYERAS